MKSHSIHSEECEHIPKAKDAKIASVVRSPRPRVVERVKAPPVTTVEE
jgi:hypothetical protein